MSGNNNDPKIEKTTRLKVDPAKLKFTTNEPEISIGFSVDDIDQELEDENFALAIILASTLLEKIFSEGIRSCLDITHNQFENIFGNRSLGSYGELCNELEVFEGGFPKETVDEFANERNKLVHDHGYLDNLENSKNKKECKEKIEKIINFIEDLELK